MTRRQTIVQLTIIAGLIALVFVCALLTGCASTATIAPPAAAPKSAVARVGAVAVETRPIVGELSIADQEHTENPWRIVPYVLDHPDAVMQIALDRAKRIHPRYIHWRNPGGERNPHPVSLEGDPPRTGPFTVEWFRNWNQKFIDLGATVGGTIRPTLLVEADTGARQELTGNPYAVIAYKVSWARQNLLWRFFYIDSPGDLADADFKKLAADFPDCTFFPEFSRDGYEQQPNVVPVLYVGNPNYQGRPKGDRVWVWPYFENGIKPPSAMARAETVKRLRGGALISYNLLTVGENEPANAWVLSALERAGK
jgi:hypothetical protein